MHALLCSNRFLVHFPQAPPPVVEAGPPACNVTYTKTVKTITMEPTGNVTHVETFSYMIPCAEAPALPPAGAPDSAEPTVTRTTRTLPQGGSAGQTGGPDADAASPDGAQPPGYNPEVPCLACSLTARNSPPCSVWLPKVWVTRY